jgi:hypothetical protein
LAHGFREFCPWLLGSVHLGTTYSGRSVWQREALTHLMADRKHREDRKITSSKTHIRTCFL